MNKDKLLNFIESLKNEKYNRFMYGPLEQREYFEIVQALNEVKSFVNEEKEEEKNYDHIKKKGSSCHNCIHLSFANMDKIDNQFKCTKYNLTMIGVPSSKICADNS